MGALRISAGQIYTWSMCSTSSTVPALLLIRRPSTSNLSYLFQLDRYRFRIFKHMHEEMLMVCKYARTTINLYMHFYFHICQINASCIPARCNVRRIIYHYATSLLITLFNIYETNNTFKFRHISLTTAEINSSKTVVQIKNEWWRHSTKRKVIYIRIYIPADVGYILLAIIYLCLN
jgi:hypothetical protein